MINMFIGSGLTLWILCGLRGYLISWSRYSKRRGVDLEQAEWNIWKNICHRPNTRLSRSAACVEEVVTVFVYCMFGPLGMFAGVMNRHQAECER